MVCSPTTIYSYYPYHICDWIWLPTTTHNIKDTDLNYVNYRILGRKTDACM